MLTTQHVCMEGTRKDEGDYVRHMARFDVWRFVPDEEGVAAVQQRSETFGPMRLVVDSFIVK